MGDKSSGEISSPNNETAARVPKADRDGDSHSLSELLETSDISSSSCGNNQTSQPAHSNPDDNSESCPASRSNEVSPSVNLPAVSAGNLSGQSQDAAGDLSTIDWRLSTTATTGPVSSMCDQFSHPDVKKSPGERDSNTSSSDSRVKLSSSDGDEFSVDAILLSSKSGYFNSCLRSGMKESLTKTVKFANLTSSVLDRTVTFINTSACSLSLSCVGEMLFAAAYLQIPDLQDYCSALLVDQINIDTYKTIYGIAEGFALTEIFLSLKSFLCKSLSKFSHTKHFKELSVDQLMEVLKSDDLNVVSEKEVLDMLVLWLQKNKETIDQSSEILGKLLNTVRIPCLYTNSYSDVSSLLKSVVKENAKVEDFLARLKHYQDHPELCHDLLAENNSKVRNGVEVIMTLGGLEQGIWKKQPSNKTKFALTSALPDSSDTDLNCPTEPFVLYDKHTSRLLTKVYEHCTCILDNYVYLLGGQTAEHDRAQFATSAVYRFDPRVFEWTELCPMNTCRSLFYVGCVNGRLYAVGGASRVGVENTVECYVPSTNQWTSMKPMLTKLHEHAGCVNGDHIYISGGHDGMNGTCSNLWCFQPDKDSWLEREPMRNARANHAMVTLGEKLLTFGGCQCTDNTVEDIWECESYDIAMDQWTVITSLPRLSSCLSAITVGKLILCFGGYTFSFCRYVDMVQVYNTENNSWKTFKLHMNIPKCLLCEKIVVNEVLLYAE